ncbi:MAG: zf-HC2 domain-containing protein [Trueperaceae bacterium]
MSEHPHDLHAFALGDLTGAAEADVARHLAGCGRCRREVRRLRAEHATTVDALPPIAPSPDARARTLAAARAVMTEPRPYAPTPKTRSRPPAWAGWAVAGFVAVAATGGLWERHTVWRASEGDRALVAGWLTRDDVTTWPLPATTGARSPGSVMVADDGVVLVVMRAPAPAGSAYRAWGVGPDGATVLADVPRTVLRAPAAGFDQVVVSLEPRRTTAAPTDPLGAAPLPTTR